MDISIIISAHHEGVLAGISLSSAVRAIEKATQVGISCEIIAVLDKPDDDTQTLFQQQSLPCDFQVAEVDFADQGLARNHAVQLARGQLVALLDADDLWSANWLVEAHRFIEKHGKRSICHPEVNWFFGENNNLFFHVDQFDPEFDPRVLRFMNCWDSLCVAAREIFEHVPYDRRDLANGFAYEDWQWNCETLERGYHHRVVPGTIHFKRRRRLSQNVIASGSNALVRRSALFVYGGANSVMNRSTCIPEQESN